MEQNRAQDNGDENVAVLKTRDELKKYFEAGDYPTEAQFAELIDSFVHLNEFITLDSYVKNLQIGGGGTSFDEIPVIAIPQLFFGDKPDWTAIIQLANEKALGNGLIPGDVFWMETEEMPDLPLTLMRVKKLVASR